MTSARTRRLVNNFEAACDAIAWIGAARPEDHSTIRATYKTAKKALVEYIASLEKAEP